MTIKNIKDFCKYWGCDSEKELERSVYKYTDCGAWISWDNNGFNIGSIVEGSDAEFDEAFLFPVESEEVDAWIEELELLCEEEWEEANGDEEREDEEDEEITLKISRIAIKSETFCTPWNGELYCVDVCEDAEERTAWIYNVKCGVKSLMFGYKVCDISHEEFLDIVFSNIPDYADDYEEEYRSY